MENGRGRLAYRRKAVGYSQDDLAARLGVERSTIVRWEAARSTPQPWVRPTLATMLNITANELETLLHGEEPGIDSLDSADADRPVRCVDAVEVRTIKRALGRYPTLASAAGDSGPSDARRVRQQLAYSGNAWLSSHFTTVARTLPDLLSEAQTHAGQARGPEIIPGYRMLVMAYRLACSMLLKYEATDVAWLAADRALNAAQVVDDDVALARATRCVARAMSQGGHYDEAIAVCTGMADTLRPRLGRQDADTMPLYGMLLLAAEITASTQGDADLAATLHEDALTAANKLAFQHEGHHTIFGMANVHAHRVSALVRLNDGGRASRYAGTIEPALLDSLPAERRACYLLDLADAHAQTASLEEAVHALYEAERLAPEEVLRRPTTHRLIARLLSSTRAGSRRTLRDIAHRVGVAV